MVFLIGYIEKFQKNEKYVTTQPHQGVMKCNTIKKLHYFLSFIPKNKILCKPKLRHLKQKAIPILERE